MILRSSSGLLSEAGNAAVVVATESHRNSLLLRLQAHGLDIAAAIEQGRYIALDAADALSTFMINGMPDPVRFLKVFGDLIVTAAKAAKGEQARVAVFGEVCHLLWAQGNAEAAIQVEELWQPASQDIRRGYSVRVFTVATFRAGWTATSSNESVQSIQPFIPGKSPW